MLLCKTLLIYSCLQIILESEMKQLISIYLHAYNGINFKKEGEEMAAMGKRSHENRINRKFDST